MRIEEFIKDLLFDFDTVVIPGFGAFVATEQSAYIEEAEQKIYPPNKEIAFSNQLQLDDGLLLGKIKDELKINQNSAIQLVQNYVEQFSKELDQNRTFTIDGLGIFSKDEENVLAFKQDESVNYLIEAYGLEPVNLPERVVFDDKLNNEKEVLDTSKTNEGDSTTETIDTDDIEKVADPALNIEATSNQNPHESQQVLSPEHIDSYENLEKDELDLDEAVYLDQIEKDELEYSTKDNGYEESISSGFDEYVEDENEKYQIEAESIETFTDNKEPKKGFSWWLLLLPLMLLVGAGYLLFSVMGKSENPYAKTMQKTTTPAKIEEKKVEKKEIVPDDKKSNTKKDTKDLSSNSTASLLKPKDEKKKITKKPEKEIEKPKPIKTSSTSNTSNANLKNGYYVIISSTQSKKEASNEAKKWTSKNYEAAVLPGPNNYNRVGLYVGTDKTTSEIKLTEYKNAINPAAWVLKY